MSGEAGRADPALGTLRCCWDPQVCVGGDGSAGPEPINSVLQWGLIDLFSVQFLLQFDHYVP